MTDSGRALAFLLHPLDLQSFVDRYWEREIVHLERRNPRHLDGLLELADLDRYLSSGRPGPDDIRLASHTGPVVTADCMRSGQPGSGKQLDPAAVLDLFAEGATLIFNAMDRVHPPIHAFCRAIEAVLGCRVQANVYLSPPGQQGFAPHFDTHDVFVLQASGEKHWNLYGAARELPLPDMQASAAAIAAGKPERSLELRCGDALYIPRGVVHEAAANEATSCHITVGMHTDTVTTLLEELLNHLSGQDVDLRRSLPPESARDASIEGLDLDELESMLRRLAGRDRIRAALNRLRERRLQRQPELHGGQLLSLARLPELSLASHVFLRSGFRVELDRLQDGIRLTLPDREIHFPAHAEQALNWLLRPGLHRVGNIEGSLDDAGKLVLAKRLVRERVLHIAEDVTRAKRL